jgi:hypothetical protein
MCATAAMPAHASEPWTADDTLAAMDAHGPLVACMVRLEVGGVGYSPYAVGAAGELGAAQLAPFGLLPLYEDWSGGASPYDPYTSLAFMDWAIGAGYGPQWSSWWYCA